MNCTQARENLPALLYGDLDTPTRNAVQNHLTSCPACRMDLAAFQRVRSALDSIPAASVQIDVPRLFQQAAARQAKQTRRWRRAALAVCGLAAALMLVVLLRLEVRVEAQQLTIRWGTAPVLGNPQALTPIERIIVREDPAALAALEDRLGTIDELLHALITDVGDRDERQTQRIARLRERVEELRLQNSRRWSDLDRSVAAMYTALFVVPKKGEKP
jgi:predicted anti-sigma-YlaC factor YlaD